MCFLGQVLHSPARMLPLPPNNTRAGDAPAYGHTSHDFYDLDGDGPGKEPTQQGRGVGIPQLPSQPWPVPVFAPGARSADGIGGARSVFSATGSGIGRDRGRGGADHGSGGGGGGGDSGGSPLGAAPFALGSSMGSGSTPFPGTSSHGLGASELVGSPVRGNQSRSTIGLRVHARAVAPTTDSIAPAMWRKVVDEDGVAAARAQVRGELSIPQPEPLSKPQQQQTATTTMTIPSTTASGPPP